MHFMLRVLHLDQGRLQQNKYNRKSSAALVQNPASHPPPAAPQARPRGVSRRPRCRQRHRLEGQGSRAAEGERRQEVVRGGKVLMRAVRRTARQLGGRAAAAVTTDATTVNCAHTTGLEPPDGAARLQHMWEDSRRPRQCSRRGGGLHPCQASPSPARSGCHS